MTAQITASLQVSENRPRISEAAALQKSCLLHSYPPEIACPGAAGASRKHCLSVSYFRKSSLREVACFAIPCFLRSYPPKILVRNSLGSQRRPILAEILRRLAPGVTGIEGLYPTRDFLLAHPGGRQRA